METKETPTPEDVAKLVDETTAVLTGEKPAEEVVTPEETVETPQEVTTPEEQQNATPETTTPEEEPERKNVFGRPTKYTPEILTESLAYLESCIDKTVIEQVYVEGIHDEDAEVEDEEKDPEDDDIDEEKPEKRFKKKPLIRYDVKRYVNLPNIGGLAVHLKVRRSTLYEWEKEHEDFSDIMEHLRAIQENRLINGGISGSYNATISKVILTKHGYREGIDATTNDKDIGAVNDARVQKKANAILDTSQ